MPGLFASLQSAGAVLLLMAWMGFLWIQSKKRKLWMPVVVTAAVSFLAWWVAEPLLGSVPIIRNYNQILPMLMLTLLIIAVGMGTMLALKITAAQWPTPVWAALVAATGWSLFRLVGSFSGFHNQSVVWLVRDFFLNSVVFSAGGFVPLFFANPLLQKKPPIRFRIVVLAAAVTAVVLLILESVLIPRAATGMQAGLITMIVGGGLALIAVTIGLILTIFTREKPGAYCGVWGLLLWVFVLTIWMATGAPWFP